MRGPSLRRCGLIVAAALMSGCDGGDSGGNNGTGGDADGDPATATLSGTAYTFNQCAAEPEQSQCRIVGATIGIVELPELSATTDSKGAYRLNVPTGSTVTPHISASGYRSIHLQTLVADRDLENLNFQTPDNQTYASLSLLMTLLGHPLADVLGCAIVSTVSKPEVVGMPFEQFRSYNPHGVPGATAAGTPAMPDAIYFNADVMPDNSTTATSEDGGVIWANVPPGVYTISASHPSQRFASFVADCRIGRVINANPPWGLYGLR